MLPQGPVTSDHLAQSTILSYQIYNFIFNLYLQYLKCQFLYPCIGSGTTSNENSDRDKKGRNLIISWKPQHKDSREGDP